jgi:hypothetical protein
MIRNPKYFKAWSACLIQDSFCLSRIGDTSNDPFDSGEGKEGPSQGNFEPFDISNGSIKGLTNEGD